MPHASDDAIPPQLVEDALERVLGSRGFRGAARKRRFLQFIVQQTQAGRADRIKAYTIAMDVFDRDASFDPLLDPVVRIQAGRIRRCLEQYYLTEGAADPIQITIPKGSYVPHFVVTRGAAMDAPPAARPDGQGSDQGNAVPGGATQTAPPAGAPPARRPRVPGWVKPRTAIVAAVVLLAMAALLLVAVWTGAGAPRVPRVEAGRPVTVRGPSLLVLPFATDIDTPAQTVFADGFTEEVIGALIRFRNLLVFGADTSFRYRSAPALHDAEPGVAVDYVLKGSVNRTGGQIQINAALIDAKDRRYLWSESYRRDISPATMPAAVIGLRQDIAVQVARALAQPHGVIQTEEARAIATQAPKTQSSYECMLRTRQYWRQLSAELHGEVRSCLESATQADPLYADAWAALAMVTIDEARLRFNPVEARPDPVSAGLQLAMHAVALAPGNPLPFQALGLAQWLRREPGLSIAAYEQALALNPNDSDILADLGRCYSLTGDWDRGIPLIREAFARNPAQPSWYRIVFAVFHYMHGRYDEALAEAGRINLPEIVLTHVALAMIHGQTGNTAEAAREVGEIRRLDPNFGEKVVFELERRNIDAAIVNKILDGLRKAGLSIPPRWNAAQGL